MLASMGSMPFAQRSVKLTQPSAISFALCRKIINHQGLENIQLEMTGCTTNIDGHIISHHLAAIMVIASHCVGFTLPGMMEEPGSLSGM
jgi:hypothetical protein